MSSNLKCNLIDGYNSDEGVDIWDILADYLKLKETIHGRFFDDYGNEYRLVGGKRFKGFRLVEKI